MLVRSHRSRRNNKKVTHQQPQQPQAKSTAPQNKPAQDVTTATAATTPAPVAYPSSATAAVPETTPLATLSIVNTKQPSKTKENFLSEIEQKLAAVDAASEEDVVTNALKATFGKK